MKAGDMKGRAALVTGAAGGVGRATARYLAEAGADLCLVDLDKGALEEVANRLRALGVRGHVQATDLARPANCASAVAAAVEAFGRLDALCNVAGVFLPSQTPKMPAADWDRTLAVNLSAPFHLIQAAIPHLLETKGAVVNVASAVGIVAQAYSAAYCATKAALIHMTKALAMEYMHQQIRFNAVAPGGMATDIAMKAKVPPDLDMALFQRVSPMRGMVEVDDVAAMVAFLATDAARAYHGACIVVDKGLSAG